MSKATKRHHRESRSRVNSDRQKKYADRLNVSTMQHPNGQAGQFIVVGRLDGRVIYTSKSVSANHAGMMSQRWVRRISRQLSMGRTK